MNKVYKSVWNESIGAWVAVSETAAARGKRNGRLAKAVLASAVTFGAAGSVSASLLSAGATDAAAEIAASASEATNNGHIDGTADSTAESYADASSAAPINSVVGATYKVGGGLLTAGSNNGAGTFNQKYLSAVDSDTSTNGAQATGIGSIAIGGNAIADASAGPNAAIAIGSNSMANTWATAVGPSATATAMNSVALGTLSVANRPGTVSVGNATNQRQIVNVAAGTQGTDVVNVSQLTPVLSALGGTAALNADGSVKAPAYTLKGTTYNTVGDALTALAASSGTNKFFNANSSLVDSNAYGKDSIAIGPNAISYDNGTIAMGVNAKADGVVGSDPITAAGGIALGYNAAEFGTGSVAIGQDSIVGVNASGSEANDAIALGHAANAVVSGAVAVGSNATASAANAVALGTGSVADRANTVSVGSSTQQRQIVNVEAGTQAYDAVNVTQLQNVTTLLGAGAKVNADGTIAAPAYTVAGSTANTVGDAVTKIDTALTSKVAYDSASHSQVTLGGTAAAPVKLTNLAIGDLSSSSTDAITGSQLYSTNQRVGSLETFEGNINNGGGIKYFHTNSTLADSSATGTDSVAIGGAAVASANNSVALGSNSVADRVNSVSVGAAGKERQITNVEAGTASTDAVNVGQLTAVSNNVDTLGSLAVKYDTNTDGTPNYEQITLGGAGATKPTLLTNVASGKLTDDSTEAVNGSQLYATNQKVAALQDFTNNVNNGGGIKYFHSNSTLADSSATGADSVAIGGAAVSSGKNSVALGSNSVADRDNTVSVGAAGSERQVTNVAAGTASTDAVNVGQLNAVSNSVTSLGASAIKYDTNADGTPDYANATLGNGNATGTALHNVAAGTGNMDAVNLGQLNDMMGQVTNLANGAYNPLFTADGNRDTEIATSSGTHSVASGANAMASGANSVASGATSVASGTNSIAVGSNASATANNAVAVGANASATANNSVALGAGSVADRANAVSVGTTAAGGQRQVTNVAAGTDGTDAVNVNQMQQSVNTGVKSAKGYTDALRSDMDSGLSLANNHINSVGAMSSAMAMMAGSAAAVADKDNRFAAGTGVYRNKAAIAIGFQKRFGTNMVITVGGSTTGEESTGGAGFAFGF